MLKGELPRLRHWASKKTVGPVKVPKFAFDENYPLKRISYRDDHGNPIWCGWQICLRCRKWFFAESVRTDYFCRKCPQTTTVAERAHLAELRAHMGVQLTDRERSKQIRLAAKAKRAKLMSMPYSERLETRLGEIKNLRLRNPNMPAELSEELDSEERALRRMLAAEKAKACED